jgi:serine/threonine protein kinase
VFDGPPPRFCQHCGKPLELPSSSSTPTTIDADATIAPTTDVTTPSEPVGIGEHIGPYQLVRWLGSGGMGTVWEAIESGTGRRVALKRLAKSMVSDETYVKRFVREAQLAAQISHSNVTFIYGAGSEQGQPYIAMELMPGTTLADKVEDDGPLEYPVAIDGIIDAVDGLIAAHELGMIHRDVKPSNCFIDTDDSIKIGDFGLSKSLVSTEVNLTQTGTFMGTPSYAAPEQIRGIDLDGRTDIYSVGATIFFLLTGNTPFKGDAMSVTAQIISDKPPACSSLNQRVPKDLDTVIAKCLEKEPSKRFQTLEELKLALLPFATQRESIADIGRRLAAFMIDQIMIQITFAVGILVYTVGKIIQLQHMHQLTGEEAAKVFTDSSSRSMMFWATISCWLFTMIYYAYCEGRLGHGVGKRLMGLKLVNKEGQRAGFWRALLRTAIIPGALGIPFSIGIWQSIYGETPVTTEDNIMQMLRGILLSYIPPLIFISTMRTSNRLLGVHGMISGTRVTRGSTHAQKTPIPIVEPRGSLENILQFGPYESQALMGESSLGKVYLGHDKQLNRNVWIVVRNDGRAPSSERINLSRSSRQRWLEGGVTKSASIQPDSNPSQARWDAYEAILGVPIQTFVGTQHKADWTQYGQVMIDIVDELKASLQDGTLPPSPSLTLIWLDKNGHAKLLDKQLVNAVYNSIYTFDRQARLAEQTPVEKSVELVQELGDLFCRTQVLPASVQDFVTELKSRPLEITTLDWADEQLETLSKHTGNLTWDSRLGMISATLGLEYVAFGLSAAILFLACFYLVPIPNTYRFLMGLALSMTLPICISTWLDGGPVFQLMKIQVCNAKGRAASNFMVALRSALTWLPMITLVGMLVLMLIVAEVERTHADPIDNPMVEGLKQHPFVYLSVIVAFCLSLCACGVGFVVAILSPQRSVVDYLLKTRLMAK